MARDNDTKMTPFRILIVLAFTFHAFGLLVIPYLDFLFSPDVKELMKHSGHGATINPSHPLVYALYLLPYPAYVGLFLGMKWGRYLLLASILVMAGGTYFLGASISGFPDTLVNLIAIVLDGAILGLAFFSPAGNDPSNFLLQADRKPAAELTR